RAALELLLDLLSRAPLVEHHLDLSSPGSGVLAGAVGEGAPGAEGAHRPARDGLRLPLALPRRLRSGTRRFGARWRGLGLRSLGLSDAEALDEAEGLPSREDERRGEDRAQQRGRPSRPPGSGACRAQGALHGLGAYAGIVVGASTMSERRGGCEPVSERLRSVEVTCAGHLGAASLAGQRVTNHRGLVVASPVHARRWHENAALPRGDPPPPPRCPPGAPAGARWSGGAAAARADGQAPQPVDHVSRHRPHPDRRALLLAERPG